MIIITGKIHTSVITKYSWSWYTLDFIDKNNIFPKKLISCLASESVVLVGNANGSLLVLYFLLPHSRDITLKSIVFCQEWLIGSPPCSVCPHALLDLLLCWRGVLMLKLSSYFIVINWLISHKCKIQYTKYCYFFMLISVVSTVLPYLVGIIRKMSRNVMVIH